MTRQLRLLHAAQEMNLKKREKLENGFNQNNAKLQGLRPPRLRPFRRRKKEKAAFGKARLTTTPRADSTSCQSTLINFNRTE